MNLKQQFLKAIEKAIDHTGHCPVCDTKEAAEACEIICVEAIIKVLKNVFGEDEEKQSDIAYWVNIQKKLNKKDKL